MDDVVLILPIGVFLLDLQGTWLHYFSVCEIFFSESFLTFRNVIVYVKGGVPLGAWELWQQSQEAI